LTGLKTEPILTIPADLQIDVTVGFKQYGLLTRKIIQGAAMTATSVSTRKFAVILLLAAVCAACAGGSGSKSAPPFPLSKQTQQLAYDYLVCATGAFEKKYIGTIELNQAVEYSLGQCEKQKQAAHDSVLKDAVAGGCETCAPEVTTELDREVRNKLIGDINYEEKFESDSGWFN
jgi:hypothetical protein